MRSATAPVFNGAHLEGACARGARPLIFDAETLALCRERGADVLTLREALGEKAGRWESVYRSAIDEFVSATRVACGVSPVGAVLYRHCRWIAKALTPALAGATAGEGMVAPVDRPMRLTHLLDGRPPELADDTLAAVALGSAGRLVDFAPVAEPAAPERREAVGIDPGWSTLFLAGPVEVPFLSRVAERWREAGDGSAAVLVTKAPVEARTSVGRLTEDELLGDAAAGESASSWLDRLRESSSAETNALLWSNPGLSAHLAFLSGAYARAMGRHVARWSRLFETREIARVVAAYPHVALDVAAAMGVPATLLPHGPMVTAEDELHRSLPDGVRIAAVSDAHVERMRGLGIGRERVGVTGLPGAAAQDEPAAARCDVLVLTVEPARARDAGGPLRIWADREIDALRAFGRSARERGWRVRVRRHPRYDRSEGFYRSVLGENVQFSPAERTLAGDSRSARVVVTFSGPSSVILDVSALGAPLVLATASWAMATPERWGLGAWAVAEDAAALDRIVGETIASDAAREALIRRTVEARTAFESIDDPLGAIVAFIASSENQARVTTRTTRETRSVTSTRG